MSNGWKWFFVILFMPVLAIWDGYVTMILWRWFVADVFHIHAINIVESIGLSLLIAGFVNIPKKEFNIDKAFEFYNEAFSKVLVCLIFGCIIHLFM